MQRTTEYRIRILADSEPYEPGDAEDAAECAEIAARDGVWGFILESRDVAEDLHTDWDHIDSCFGFLGALDRCEEAMRWHLDGGQLAGHGDVPVLEDDGSLITYWHFS